MGELMEYEDYEHFKAALDWELLSAADHFVKIGYLLKKARDTNILYESGYKNLYEFAKAEYGIDRGTVSRYIAINDRFSVGGNSPHLQDHYSNRGVAKLQEMLTMSDEVIEAIPEQTTKSELQAIKKDIKEEEQITDMEVMLEETPSGPVDELELDRLYQKSLYYFLKTDIEAFERVCEAMQATTERQLCVMVALAPNGIATPRVRVPKVGTILMSIQGLDHPMTFVNVRTNENEKVYWNEIESLLDGWITKDRPEEIYKWLYGIEMEPQGQQMDQKEKKSQDTVVEDQKEQTEVPEQSQEAEVEQIQEDQVEVIEEKVAPVQLHEEPYEELTRQQLTEVREWIPTKVKEVPDEAGKYLICRKGYSKGEMLYDIDSCRINAHSKEMEWVLWKDRVLFWMPLPKMPEYVEVE